MALTLPEFSELLAPIEAKAVTGPGVTSWMYGTPVHTLSRDPNRLMAEAQALFHINGWVAAAERALGGRFVRMDWHLEDENGETIDERSPEAYQGPLRLLQRPSQAKTRAQLWAVTFRHMGLPGNGFWYLDQRDQLAGTPLSLIYINPARMTPATDSGGNVVGWVLDHPENQVLNRMGADYQRTGVPLTTEEVIHFPMDEPDWGVWGIGWVESAQRKIELDRLSDSHGGGVLSSGGRLSGLITPKTGVSVTDDQWVQFTRDWRSVTSDPDAAKRLNIAKMPLDFTQMMVSLKELQYIDITKQTKEDILAMAGVPLSMLGINVTAGLNADRAGADDAAIWETIKQRSETFREKIQYELLDRWQALGVTVKLILDYPSFEEDSGQFENAALARTIPMTIDQRREQVGLDPLDGQVYGDLGQSIYLDQSMVRVDTIGVPPVEPVNVVTPTDQGAPVSTDEEVEVIEGKADLKKPLLGLRARTEVEWEPKIRSIVANVLTEQRRLAVSKSEHALRKREKNLSWWNDAREHRRFMVALEPLIVKMAQDVAKRTTQTIKKPEGKADSWLEKVIASVRTAVGLRITGINATTKEKVQAAIAEGVERGLGAAELGTLIGDSAAFNEARAEMIGRTETAQVYNDAALHSYGALEVEQVEAIDGDHDAACAARNGKRYPIEEAMGIADHPNGTLDWLPVVN